MLLESLETQVLGHLQSYRQEGLSLHKEIENLFIAGVDFLRLSFPNSAVARLTVVAWNVIGFGITPICLGLPVSVMTFIVAGTLEAPQAMIAVPRFWANMIRKDPLTQLGALVFVCSQAVDYYHDRLTIDPGNISLRAHAYEADYLSTVRQLAPDWELNEYQLGVLQEFPEGLATPKANRTLYCIRPFITA
jgi:hypothetical protein